MKVLTIRQPYASLVVMGLKTLETRPLLTNYRGPVLIHAAASKYSHIEAAGIIQKHDVKHILTPWMNKIQALPVGCIIGSVDLSDCLGIQVAKDTLKNAWFNKGDISMRDAEQELAFGDYINNKYAYVLKNPRNFINHIPAKGQLGFWGTMQDSAFSILKVVNDKEELHYAVQYYGETVKEFTGPAKAAHEMNSMMYLQYESEEYGKKLIEIERKLFVTNFSHDVKSHLQELVWDKIY